MRKLAIALVLIAASIGSAFAQTTSLEEYYAAHGKPWYMMDKKPTTLKGVVAEDIRFLGADNVGFKMMGNVELCGVMKQVKVSCDYNTRTALALFLAVNGKNLFRDDGQPTDGFITRYSGKAEENKVLVAAVRKNANLFKNGNLTAEDVQKHWK